MMCSQHFIKPTSTINSVSQKLIYIVTLKMEVLPHHLINLKTNVNIQNTLLFSFLRLQNNKTDLL